MKIKPQPNDCNISVQHIVTLFGTTCCTCLATLLRSVVMCCMLGVVGSSLKMVKFSCTICGCCMMLSVFQPDKLFYLRAKVAHKDLF